MATGSHNRICGLPRTSDRRGSKTDASPANDRDVFSPSEPTGQGGLTPFTRGHGIMSERLLT